MASIINGPYCLVWMALVGLYLYFLTQRPFLYLHLTNAGALPQGTWNPSRTLLQFQSANPSHDTAWLFVLIPATGVLIAGTFRLRYKAFVVFLAVLAASRTGLPATATPRGPECSCALPARPAEPEAQAAPCGRLYRSTPYCFSKGGSHPSRRRPP